MGNSEVEEAAEPVLRTNEPGFWKKEWFALDYRSRVLSTYNSEVPAAIMRKIWCGTQSSEHFAMPEYDGCLCTHIATCF
jgi:hypothetical protein